MWSLAQRQPVGAPCHWSLDNPSSLPVQLRLHPLPLIHPLPTPHPHPRAVSGTSRQGGKAWPQRTSRGPLWAGSSLRGTLQGFVSGDPLET